MIEEPTFQEWKQQVETLKEVLRERERVERALRESEDKYRNLYEKSKQTEELYRSFLESSVDAVILYNPEGKVLYVNPAFTKIFGWTLEGIVGKTIPIIPDSEKEKTLAMIRELVYKGASFQGFETRRCTKDGALLDVSISAARMNDPKGNLSGILVTLRDISERKMLETQLLHAHKMEAIGTLAGGIAHDFNNILQAISGYAQILLMGMDPRDPDYRKLEAIEQSSQRASELTKQLLIFSRKVQAEFSPIDLNASVETVSQLLERTIPKMISIELHLGKDVKPISADPLQIEQIIMNLGVNARDAMPDGGRLLLETKNTILDEGYCKTHLGAKPGEYVCLTIRDTGCGMGKDVYEHIFEPFFTTKDAGEGTGLGLAIVYGIVKNHGGYVFCTSLEGEGTHFDVFFPVLQREKEYMLPEYPENQHLPEGHETILLVDDEVTILEVVQDMLNRFGYNTLTAESGERAVEIFMEQKERIDLVILDLNMPGMGGHKCLDELRNIDASVKVVIASGYSANRKVQNTLKNGAAGFLPKPYRYKDILQKLREVLDRAS